MYWNSETFVCLFFETEFYSNSDQPRTLNSSPVSASQKRLLGLRISSAAFSGPRSDSRNLGLVQKLHFNGRVHTTPQQLAFQPPLAHHSAGTLSPHPRAVPSPAPDPDLQKGVLVASPYHGDHGVTERLHLRQQSPIVSHSPLLPVQSWEFPLQGTGP